MRISARGSVVPLLIILGLTGSQRDSSVAGTNVTLTGHITDAVSGSPLQNIMVSVEGRANTTVTNALGKYTLFINGEGVAGTTVFVSASGVGYRRAVKEVRLADAVTTLDFALRGAPVALDEIVVAPATRRQEVLGASVSGPASATRTNWNHRGERDDASFNTEGYAHFEDNPFRSTGANPLSTFSIDVDRASYSNIRRFIRDGRRPPMDAVRIEEMINYFPYSYPAPEGDDPFSVTTEVSEAPWQPKHKIVRIGIQSRRLDVTALPPSNLVFLIDVSGSMQAPNKLPLLKSSFRLLVNELRGTDRVAIVVYAGAPGLVLPSTPGDEKDRILDALTGLEAGGSTAGGAGIQLAYRIARENYMEGGNNRVILATDGDFNVGASSDAEMVRLIERMRDQGTFLTVLGFGTGNLQDAKMEQMADHGNGHFAYIDNLMEARKVFVNEIGATLLTIAKDVKIQVEFNPRRVQGYRLIGYENRLMQNEDFNNDAKDAGDLGAGHSVTALYEIIPVGVESPVEIQGVDTLRYRVPGAVSGAAESPELLYVKLRYKRPDGDTSRLLSRAVLTSNVPASVDLRFTAAVAGFGMLLRDSPHAGSLQLHDVLVMARGSLGADAGGYRSEFVRLVESVRDLELLAVATP